MTTYDSPLIDGKTGSAMRILLVDDDAVTLRVLSRMLRSEGHHVDTCEAPVPALEMLDGAPYEILLTDQVMEGMPGLELARRARLLRVGLRCFVVSGQPAPPPDECAHVTWISKPVDIDLLLAAIAPGADASS